MALTKEQKKKVVQELKEKIEKQKSIVFVDFRGVNVKDLSELRRELKQNDSELKVAKKTLSRIALKEKGLESDMKKLEGEIGLVFGYRDAIASAKTVYKFSKENPSFKILGGFLENKFVLSENIITLAQLPTKEELLTRLTGSIWAPVSNLVYALQYNLKGLITVLARVKT